MCGFVLGVGGWGGGLCMFLIRDRWMWWFRRDEKNGYGVDLLIDGFKELG